MRGTTVIPKVERARRTELHLVVFLFFLILLRCARLVSRRRLCTGCIPFPRLFGLGSSLGLVEGIKK